MSDIRKLAVKLFVEYSKHINAQITNPPRRKEEIERAANHAIVDAKYFISKLNDVHPDEGVKFLEKFGISVHES